MCLVGEMSFGEVSVGEMPVGEVVIGEVSGRRNVRRGSVHGGSVRRGYVRRGSVSRGNVRRGTVREPRRKNDGGTVKNAIFRKAKLFQVYVYIPLKFRKIPCKSLSLQFLLFIYFKVK